MKRDKIIAVVFMFSIIFLSLVTLFSKKQVFSEIENRTLAPAPKLSVSKIMNREFMTGLDDYITDHFFARNAWTGIKGGAEKAVGKKEENDIFILEDRLIKRSPEPEERIVSTNIDGINAFAAEFNKPVSFMLVPTSAEIQRQLLPRYGASTVWSQQEFIKSVQAALDPKIQIIDIYTKFLLHNEDYIYYKTDHHWTTKGAYYAYLEAGKQLAYVGLSLNNFSIENVSHDFYGTLQSQANVNSVPPDIIEVYKNENGSRAKSVEIFDGQKYQTYPSMYFKENLEKRDKYAVFLGQNEPLIKIETDAGTNRKILIFKDSYAHAFVPFLTEHFDTITLVDLRYFTSSYLDYVNPNDYDEILILYSMDLFISDSSIVQIDGQE